MAKAGPGEAATYAGADLLSTWVAEILAACGLRPLDARRAGDLLLRTTLRGRDTHGVARLPRYVGVLASGALDPQARLRQRRRHNMLLFDCGRGFAPPLVSRAVERSVAAAAEAATALALIRTSGHTDALGTYLLAPAEAGMMALLCKTTPPLMALPGSRRAAIGNNPIAFAMPLAGRPPLIFDMATSRAARSRIIAADVAGRAIPTDWAMDASGVPTADPAAALKGMLLPIAGHKGIGLAMMVQGLAATLQPAAGRRGERRSSEDLFLLVINPRLVPGERAYRANAEAWLSTYMHASGEARYPGQRAAECEAGRKRTGVPLAPTLLRAAQPR
jgi:LDH2 family malate/lactate/ureidoglycolate dehydrogenase